MHEFGSATVRASEKSVCFETKLIQEATMWSPLFSNSRDFRADRSVPTAIGWD